jgi:UPF0716 protein FxsA
MPFVLLLILFIALPIVEIYVIIQVGQVIGALPTIAFLVFESILGGWLVKREGGRAWRGLTETLASGRMPGQALADAALVLIGGTLLLTPGFVTDVVGFFFILPFTRPIARKVLLSWAARRMASRVQRGYAPSRSGVHTIYRAKDPD